MTHGRRQKAQASYANVSPLLLRMGWLCTFPGYWGLLSTSLPAGETPVPEATRWGEPIEGMLEASGAQASLNYGGTVPKEKFGEEVRHAGVDWAYFQAGTTVVAVAAGRVRYAGHVPTILWADEEPATPTSGAVNSVGPQPAPPDKEARPPVFKKAASEATQPVYLTAEQLPGKRIRKWGWGGLVVVEHLFREGKPGTKEQRICSLYGHLGRLLPVREGEAVQLGQTLGVIGKGPGEENGYYNPHLHFGLHRGPYEDPPTHLPVRLNGVELQCRVLDLDQKYVYVDLQGIKEPIPVKRYWERFLVPNTAGRRYPIWVTGYVRMSETLEEAGWVDPVDFLRSRLQPAGQGASVPPAK